MIVRKDRALRRCELLTLLSKGFSHPETDFFKYVAGGEYQESIESAYEGLFGQPRSLPKAISDFPDYEACYIELFQTGKKGAPMVGLHAGDYNELLDGQPRPEFMLEYSQWYRHFGLRVRQDNPAHDLPDHVVCQLQFLAWLAQLEANAIPGSEQQIGYQRAQRDFIDRHVRQFVGQIAYGLLSAKTRLPLEPLFVELGQLATELIDRTGRELTATLKSNGSREATIPNEGAARAMPGAGLWS